MDALSRAHQRTLLRMIMLGVVAAALLTVLSVLFGGRSASAAEADQPSATSASADPISGLVGGLVQGVGGTVGSVVHAAVPAPPAPAPAAVPAPPAPAPVVAPVPAAAPAPPVPASVVAPAPVTDPAPPVPVAVRPGGAASAATSGPATSAPAPAPAAAAASPVAAPSGLAGALSGTTDAVASAAGSGVVGHTLHPLVAGLDGVLGSVPLVGPVVGDHTLGAVTTPVVGLLDGTLGTVGGVVADVPVLVGSLPAPLGGTPPLLPIPDVPVAPLPGHVFSGAGPTAAPDETASVAEPLAGGALSTTTSLQLRTPGSEAVSADHPQVAGASSAVSPAAPAGTPFDGSGAPLPAAPLPAAPTGSTGSGSGAGGGSAGGSSAAASPEHLGTIALAIGATSSADDQTLPVSVVADHDVAPD